MENKSIWKLVCKTDPNHTKKVSYGQFTFTAIDAYSQIEKATEIFGPVGIGWGWKATETLKEKFILIELDFWYMLPGDREDFSKPRHFQTFGCAELYNSKDRFDSDAPKKALTDAITKALSYLGFNSDVFLGKFDDSKYVSERIEEIEKEKEQKKESKSKGFLVKGHLLNVVKEKGIYPADAILWLDIYIKQFFTSYSGIDEASYKSIKSKIEKITKAQIIQDLQKWEVPHVTDIEEKSEKLKTADTPKEAKKALQKMANKLDHIKFDEAVLIVQGLSNDSDEVGYKVVAALRKRLIQEIESIEKTDVNSSRTHPIRIIVEFIDRTMDTAQFSKKWFFDACEVLESVKV